MRAHDVHQQNAQGRLHVSGAKITDDEHSDITSISRQVKLFVAG